MRVHRKGQLRSAETCRYRVFCHRQLVPLVPVGHLPSTDGFLELHSNKRSGGEDVVSRFCGSCSSTSTRIPEAYLGKARVPAVQVCGSSRKDREGRPRLEGLGVECLLSRGNGPNATVTTRVQAFSALLCTKHRGHASHLLRSRQLLT